MRVAVFGDTHGHIRLMLELCRLWQVHNGAHLDLVLQLGDLGFFPGPSNLDRATKRFARKDSEELGFHTYFRRPEPLQRDALVERTLGGDPASLDTVRCPIIWCQGNHEGFGDLSELTDSGPLTAVDTYDPLMLLRPGHVVEVSRYRWPDAVAGSRERHGVVVLGDDGPPRLFPQKETSGAEHETLGERTGSVRVAALGGGPEPDGAWQKDLPEAQHLAWVDHRAAARLRGTDFDVLISHCGPRGIQGLEGPWASDVLREAVVTHQPAYHLFAHHGQPVPPLQLGLTRCRWLNDTNFVPAHDSIKPARLEHGCMALLRWSDAQSHSFDVVWDPWFVSMNSRNWRDHGHL